MLGRLTHRALRRCLIRPWTEWRVRWETVEQLTRLAKLGVGVNVEGPIHIGAPSLTRFGDDVCINPGFTVLGDGSLTIGNHVHFGEETRIITSNHRFQDADCLPYDHQRVIKPVTIGDCAWIGDRVTIVPGVVIGEGAIVAAGSVVTKDVADLAIVGGAPAAVLRYRDADEYAKLKAAGRFLNWPRDYDMVNRRKVHIQRRALNDA
jgi:maltose O-acetyltransferase